MWLAMLPNRPFLSVLFCDTLYSVEYSKIVHSCACVKQY